MLKIMIVLIFHNVHSYQSLERLKDVQIFIKIEIVYEEGVLNELEYTILQIVFVCHMMWDPFFF